MNGVAVVEKIMIVDDDEIVCRIADKILNQKYETFSVNSGEEALEQAEAGQPDLILMDLNMPEMERGNRLGLLAHDFPRLPVVVVSALTSPDVQRRVLDIPTVFAFVPKSTMRSNWLSLIVESCSELLNESPSYPIG